jgi:hypothetical protein
MFASLSLMLTLVEIDQQKEVGSFAFSSQFSSIEINQIV